MQYKTIVLEMLQDRPALHQQLRSTRTLFQALDEYASALKTSHTRWMEQLRGQRPGSEESQLSSEALELALEDLQESLPPESAADEGEGPSLDGAMAFLSRHTPSA